MKSLYNEARLRVIDKLLQKGWCSYLDMAKAIDVEMTEENAKKKYGLEKFVKTGEESYNKCLLGHFRSTLAGDCRIILDIYALVHYGWELEKSGSKEDNERRQLIAKELFEVTKKKQYGTRIPLELCTDKYGEVDKNTIVTFYKYSEGKKGYSLFKSGDFNQYQSLHLKSKASKRLKDAIGDTISDKDEKAAYIDPKMSPVPEVSELIKQAIGLKGAQDSYNKENRKTIKKLRETIEKGSKEKEQGWVDKVINFYRNLKQLSKGPFSIIEERELAELLRDYVFFLAEESRYKDIGGEFDEALALYVQLSRDGRHKIEDSIYNEILGIKLSEEEIQAIRNQVNLDDVRIAEVLRTIARVLLDTGDVVSAQKKIQFAKRLIGGLETLEAKAVLRDIYQLESIMHAIENNMDLAFEANGVAMDLMAPDDYSDTCMDIRATHADILSRRGDIEKAAQEYEALLEHLQSVSSEESKAKILIGYASVEMGRGQFSKALLALDKSIAGFEMSLSSEPYKILPNILAARLSCTIALASLGQPKMAIDNCDAALALLAKYPDCEDLCLIEEVSLLISKRDLLEAIGDNENAEKALRTAQSVAGKMPSIPEAFRDAL